MYRGEDLLRREPLPVGSDFPVTRTIRRLYKPERPTNVLKERSAVKCDLAP
jgi:hypothetical protein